MKHVFREYNSGIKVRKDPFHPFLPEEWNQHTSTMLRTFLIQHLPNPIGPQPVISGPISSSRPAAYSRAAIELMSFKKGIKREITAYPSLKDERYFDGFKRSLFIVAKTHECSDVLASLGFTRGRSTILKLWKHPRMTLLGPQVPETDPPALPESDLDIPDDPILDFVNSHCHNSEDLDQALQAYQAYQVPYPQDSTMTPERTINHHFTYHIAQAS